MVAVGATLDPVAGTARVISSATSAHVRHIRAGQDRVAVCQVDGARWATVEGVAVVRDDPAVGGRGRTAVRGPLPDAAAQPAAGGHRDHRDPGARLQPLHSHQYSRSASVPAVSSFEADPQVPGSGRFAGPAGVARGRAGRARRATRLRRDPHPAATGSGALVGAWCFLDAYGPHDLAGSPGMRVGPHPHTGLQTVTWLVAGEVLHRDTLGTVQEIRPGQLNLMTAGRGIAHAEETPRAHGPVLHGVQLWVALPHADRDMPPAFAHHADLPVVADGGLDRDRPDGLAGRRGLARRLLHAAARRRGHAGRRHRRLSCRCSPISSMRCWRSTARPPWTARRSKPGPLLYLGPGRRSLRLAAGAPARLLLLGGEPFEERLVMWWNFVARDHDEIVAMRADWVDGTPRFGTVHGYDGPPLPAPPMPITRLVPRGRIALSRSA